MRTEKSAEGKREIQDPSAAACPPEQGFATTQGSLAT